MVLNFHLGMQVNQSFEFGQLNNSYLVKVEKRSCYFQLSQGSFVIGNAILYSITYFHFISIHFDFDCLAGHFVPLSSNFLHNIASTVCFFLKHIHS